MPFSIIKCLQTNEFVNFQRIFSRGLRELIDLSILIVFGDHIILIAKYPMAAMVGSKYPVKIASLLISQYKEKAFNRRSAMNWLKI